MENETAFKIVFWASTAMMFVFSAGILLLLQQIYHITLHRIQDEDPDDLSVTDKQDGSPDIFSEREMKVLLLVLEGYCSADIAGKLDISIKTVDYYKKKMVDKTGSKNFMTVIRYAIDHRILPPKELKKQTNSKN